MFLKVYYFFVFVVHNTKYGKNIRIFIHNVHYKNIVIKRLGKILKWLYQTTYLYVLFYSKLLSLTQFQHLHTDQFLMHIHAVYINDAHMYYFIIYVIYNIYNLYTIILYTLTYHKII